jgi:hypothetical protein
MRLTLSSQPPSPEIGTRFELHARLENRGPLPIAGVTLELRFPEGVSVLDTDPQPGHATGDARTTRWSLGELAPGTFGTLVASATVDSTAGREIAVCATLISQGSPLEHCIGLTPTHARGASEPPLDVFAAFTPAAGGGLFPERTPGELFRWAILVLGTILLGVWLGAAARRRNDAA